MEKRQTSGTLKNSSCGASVLKQLLMQHCKNTSSSINYIYSKCESPVMILLLSTPCSDFSHSEKQFSVINKTFTILYFDHCKQSTFLTISAYLQ
jgi:hypothetical protein